MTELTLLIFTGLASYRVSRFIVLERGPFAIMERLRSWIDPQDSHEVLHCVHCMGFWVSLLLGGFVGYAVFNHQASFVVPFIFPLSISGFVSLIGDVILSRR